ncbi:hypothetical protein LBMAG53_39790 [Planctomycetota bacterium]|nr:hypothetical protein LBMAG53_39790 [Planctomycetota bacterium]
MALPLSTVLAASVTGSALVALATASPTPGAKALHGVTAAVALLVALVPVVGELQRYINGNLLQVLAVAAGILALVCAFLARKKPIPSTVLVVAGLLLVLVAMRWVT